MNMYLDMSLRCFQGTSVLPPSAPVLVKAGSSSDVIAAAKAAAPDATTHVAGRQVAAATNSTAVSASARQARPLLRTALPWDPFLGLGPAASLRLDALVGGGAATMLLRDRDPVERMAAGVVTAAGVGACLRARRALAAATASRLASCFSSTGTDASTADLSPEELDVSFFFYKPDKVFVFNILFFRFA